MVRGKDRFWEYVEDLKGRFFCKFCERSFAGGIARVKSHLSGVRGRDIDICQKVPEDVQFAAFQAIGVPDKKKVRCLRSSNNDQGTEIISALNKKTKSSHGPTTLEVCKKDKSVVDKVLAKFIISNHTSLDLSKIPFLVDLLKSIAEFGPTYELPNSSTVMTQLIPDVYEEIEEYVSNVKKFFTTSGCTLMMSNVVKDSKLVCMNVFAYTPYGFAHMNKIEVPEGGMTFRHFIDSIFSVIESLGPAHVVQYIFNDTDDHLKDSITDFIDQNFFLSVQGMILKKYPRIFLSRCAGREFGVLLILTYLTVPWIHKTTQLAKLIFKYLFKHEINLPPRRESGRNKEYNRNGLTKIAIDLFLLNSILEVEQELQALQLRTAPASGDQAGSSSENEITEVVDKAIHSSEFWIRGKKVVKVLQSLFQVLDFIDDNGSTLGYLHEAMKRAEHGINQHPDGNDQIHYEMISKMFRKWRSRVMHPIYAAAAFLNPAYMCSENFREDAEMQKGLHLLSLLVPLEEQVAFLRQVQLYRMKETELFTATAMNMLSTIHPRKWWECFGDQYPILQKYAIRILSQTCATSPCDDSNFQPNDILEELKMKMSLMEKSSTLKSQNMEPINLERFSGLPEYSNDFVNRFFEELDWSDDIHIHDLLVINNPNDRILTASDSNDNDDLIDISSQSDWMFLSDFIDHYDLLDFTKQNDRMLNP